MQSDRRGALLWVGCLQYFLAEALVAQGYRGPYSLRLNYISDLAATACTAVCSPLHPLMNAAFILQGALILGGSVAAWRLGPPWLWRVSCAVMAASAPGIVLVGLVPEDAGSPLHVIGAGENLLASGVAMGLMALSLRRVAPLRAAIGGVGAVLALAALAALGQRADPGLGIGVVERIAAYPTPVWLAATGLWLWREGWRPRMDSNHRPAA